MLKDPHSLFTVVIALGTDVELIVYLPTLNNMVKYALNIIMLCSDACLKYQKWKQTCRHSSLTSCGKKLLSLFGVVKLLTQPA